MCRRKPGGRTDGCGVRGFARRAAAVPRNGDAPRGGRGRAMGRARRRNGNGRGRGGRRSGGGSYVLLGLIFVALLGVTVYVVKAGGQAHAGAPQAQGTPPGPQDGTSHDGGGTADGGATPGASGT